MSPEIKKKLGEKINELFLGTILLIGSTLSLLYTLHNGISDMQVVSFIGFKVSLFVFIGTVFVKFLNGVGCNINKEIFEENNIAAAILVGLFWVGLSISIALGNLG